MKRLVIGGIAATLIAGGAGISFAGQGGPSFNGNNDFGLCTAYFAQQAHNPNGVSGPFAAMQEAYDAANGDGSFEDYCQSVVDGDGSPGNSEHGHGGH